MRAIVNAPRRLESRCAVFYAFIAAVAEESEIFSLYVPLLPKSTRGFFGRMSASEERKKVQKHHHAQNIIVRYCPARGSPSWPALLACAGPPAGDGGHGDHQTATTKDEAPAFGGAFWFLVFVLSSLVPLFQPGQPPPHLVAVATKVKEPCKEPKFSQVASSGRVSFFTFFLSERTPSTPPRPRLNVYAA